MLWKKKEVIPVLRKTLPTNQGASFSPESEREIFYIPPAITTQGVIIWHFLRNDYNILIKRKLKEYVPILKKIQKKREITCDRT